MVKILFWLIITVSVFPCAHPIFESFYCPFTECCTKEWITANITGLQSVLSKRVFGQHIVTDAVRKAVTAHLNNKSPSKALALSFNGWTGSGKTFVSKIIAEHMFKKGMKSKFYHHIIATHKYVHKSEVDSYRKNLQSQVVQAVTKCPRSLFVFDDVDKMPEGLIDVLKPYLDTHSQIEGVNYRESIFLFLSNTGGNLINEAVLDNWKEGKEREDLTIKQMDQVINLGAFNSKDSGFWHSSLIEDNLIDFFIPFLPLERSHIKQCAKADLEEKGHPVTESVLNSVADEMLYFPKDLNLFSKSGCKKVSSKVDYAMG